MGVVAIRVTAVFVLLLVVWGGFALWYQIPAGRGLRSLGTIGWIAFGVAVVIALWHGRALVGLSVFIVAFGCLLWWWQRLPPSNNRAWADDVAQMTTGTVEGDRVVVHNVRNFEWRTDTDYTQRWETRSYDLSRLSSLDMILSYWSGQAIAHVLISFGFNDASHVVFSVEIRREKTESFSEIGGFFKEFELSIIAADERDVIRVRTNVRGEDDYLYRIRLPVADIRALFLAYIAHANALTAEPRFYNTITVNCTTLVYHMMRRIVGYLPWDYRILLSGYLPEYVYKVGGLDSRYSLRELREFGRITQRAKQSASADTFSTDIRTGVPAVPPPAGVPPAAHD